VCAASRDRTDRVRAPEGARLGLGHGADGQELVGDEPFAVLLSDDVMPTRRPVTEQLIEQYAAHRGSIAGNVRARRSTAGCGAAAPGGALVEIATSSKTIGRRGPSDLGVLGRYILSPRIFDKLERPSGAGGEIQLATRSAPCQPSSRSSATSSRCTPPAGGKANIAMSLESDLADEVRRMCAARPAD
jgi:UTP-glucose-1-phosphate uridylyltransferase